MKTFFPILVLFAFAISSCEQHKMGYAERNSEVGIFEFSDSSYSYWIEVDEDYSPDSIDLEVMPSVLDSSDRLLAFGASVSACDSLEKNLVLLPCSSGWFTMLYADGFVSADSSGCLDLGTLPDSSEIRMATDSIWDDGFTIRLNFAQPDSVQPEYLSIDLWSLTQKGDTVRAHFFAEYKSVYDPGSGGGMGKIFCENHAMNAAPNHFLLPHWGEYDRSKKKLFI